MGLKAGFVGTGLMGGGMARNLVRQGHAVRIFNRTRAKAEAVAREGGTVVESPADAARDADVVVTMLSDPAALLEVVEGPQGILSTIRKDAVRLMEKDLDLDAAHALKVPMPALAATKQVFTACMGYGLADEDFATTIKFFERAIGVEIRPR